MSERLGKWVATALHLLLIESRLLCSHSSSSLRIYVIMLASISVSKSLSMSSAIAHVITPAYASKWGDHPRTRQR